MSLLLILTITLPLLGAGGTLGLSLVPRVRPYSRYVALTAAVVTTILLLASRWMEPVVAVPSLWQPSLLFGATLTLQVDAATQPLTFALALVTCAAILVELACVKQKPRPQLVAALLALLPAGLMVFWSANILTLVISWAIYDLIQAIAHSAADGSARTAIRDLILGNLATLFLWVGALLSGGGADSEPWSLLTLSGVQLTLWIVAGILRLGIYPFHLPSPHDLVSASPFAAPLLLGPILGWGLWLRLITAHGGLFPGGTWVLTLAAVTMVLGGLLAWSCESPRRTLTWIGMGANGAVLLAAGVAGENGAVVIAAGSVAWVLGMTLLFLTGGLSDDRQQKAFWYHIPSLVGALALLGVPFTLGFVTEATLLGGIAQEGHVEWGNPVVWGTIFGNLFLVPSLVRWLLPSSNQRTSLQVDQPITAPTLRGPLVARAIGLGSPALLLIVAGLYPPLLIVTDGDPVPSLVSLFTMPGSVGWLAWVLSLACGGLLAWQGDFLRSKIALLLNTTHDLLRLEWLYDALSGALDRGLGVFRVADEIVGGAGAMLWSWLLFLLFLLMWGGL
ncbi:MAG: hypothetical protein SXV54_14155 [Chloroflexota bacterium]|nr:hypothetical protein [Chloroflexota bacterium]